MTAWLAEPLPALAQDDVVPPPRCADLSPWGMLSQRRPVVKAVLIGLVFARSSPGRWWLAKSIEIFSRSGGCGRH